MKTIVAASGHGSEVDAGEPGQAGGKKSQHRAEDSTGKLYIAFFLFHKKALGNRGSFLTFLHLTLTKKSENELE